MRLNSRSSVWTDNAGDLITFTCSGDIQLTATLTITGKMTIDGIGESVTLDGQQQYGVFQVNSGVLISARQPTSAVILARHVMLSAAQKLGHQPFDTAYASFYAALSMISEKFFFMACDLARGYLPEVGARQ